eukprot:321837_1
MSFIMLAFVALLSFIALGEEPIGIEITSSGDTEIHDLNAGRSEPSPPSSPVIFRKSPKPPSPQIWVTFTNDSPDTIDLIWDDGGPNGIHQGTINPGTSTKIGTFEGHIFYFRYPNQSKREYICYMKNGKTQFIFKDAETRKQEATQLQQEKELFKKHYYERTGRKWEAFYPRNPPIHHMYAGDYIGQKHKITSNHSFYHCYPITDSIEDIEKCRDKNIMNFEWEVLSTSPRVIYLAQPFLSDFEIEHIKLLATPKLTESTVGHGSGAYASSVRTSKGCFIDRCETDVIDWIFRRIADVIQVEESFLWHMIGSENLQVLRYDKNQEFKAHSDYNVNREQMRYLSMIIYMNTLDEGQGGDTIFPLANLSVVPKKGHVVAFYSILEDGNADYMSLHGSTPLKYGVKWSVPVWVWDPSQS